MQQKLSRELTVGLVTMPMIGASHRNLEKRQMSVAPVCFKVIVRE